MKNPMMPPPIPVVSQPPVVEEVVQNEKKTQTAKVRVVTVYEMPLFAHTQNILIKPGVETVLDRDHWVTTQLEAYYLKEV